MFIKKFTKLMVWLLALCVLCYSCYRAYDIFVMRKQADSSYDSLNQYVQKPQNNNRNESKENNENISIKKPVQRQLDVDFEALKETNSEFWGWLYLVNDYIINYPVVQHDDNAYYLNHLFDGKANATGTLFLDYRNNKDELDDNSIIYGHTMRNEVMFHALGRFKEQKYYEEHPYFLLELPDKEYKLEVFACYVTNPISDAYTINFNEEDGIIVDESGERKISYKYSESVPTFEKWYKGVMEQNKLETDIEVNKGDKIFTFSACDYAFDNARVVVHCKATDTSQ